MVLVFVLGLGAAVLLALGFVIQQHAAARAPAEERLSIRLLLDLARRPLWLGGIAAMVGGQILGATALARGSLPLVEPLLAANILFALPLSAAWTRQRLGWREWAGAFVLMGGLALFVGAAGPTQEQASKVSTVGWIIACCAIAGVVALLIWAAKRLEVVEEATLLAAGAGILYGLQDGFTQRSLLVFGHGGLGAMMASWHPYALVAAAIVGLILAQSAFEAAPLAASLPTLTIAEPITGIGLGAGLFSQGLRLSPLPLALELLGILLMAVGVYMVARSPVVTGGGASESGTGTSQAAA
ncbi:MAG TPA: DMT family transporter [Acidimicrobiales bacterium]|nr:DMT family transporter [Acidimicrobiales bacterium]